MNNMKTILYTLLALTLIGLSAGCSDETKEEEQQARTMQFTMLHPSVSRANDAGFETNDKIGIYITEWTDGKPSPLQVSGNHTNNEPLTFNGSAWIPRKPIYWSEQAVDIYAYYPHAKLTSVDEFRFTIATDQDATATADALGGYEASDFLWGKTSNVTPDDNPVSILFKHRMSKLNVIINRGPEYEGELPDNTVVKIHNTVPDALIDLSLGMPAKDPVGSAASINCKKLAKDQFTAIIVPQRIPSVRPFVELIMEGVSYLVESTFTFKPGIEYTLTLTVNTQPGKILIEIGGQIDNTWE